MSVFQQFIIRSTSNHISSLLKILFNKYGYHFSFHQSMLKEFTIISTPDLCFILFMDVWWKRHDFQFRLFTSEDISQIFPDIGFTILVQNNESNYFFLSLFFISNRVPTKPKVKSWNVACAGACTLGRMQSPLLIIFLCLKLTF